MKNTTQNAYKFCFKIIIIKEYSGEGITGIASCGPSPSEEGTILKFSSCRDLASVLDCFMHWQYSTWFIKHSEFKAHGNSLYRNVEVRADVFRHDYVFQLTFSETT